MTEREAWLAFSWSGLDEASMPQLTARYGSLTAAWQDRQRAFSKLRLSRERRFAVKTRARRFDLQTIMRDLHRFGIRYVCSFEPDYPARLKTISAPPPVLYIQGDSRVLRRPAVAIVGSRQATEYGKRQTRQFATDLAQRGITIVSGLAYGIDSAAHEAACSAGISVAVIAGGLGLKLMSWQDHLAKRIIQSGGAVVSEFPPDVPPVKHHFPKRNRIIAGLCPVTLVGEARENSGALITARLAVECGATVMCVPHDLERPSAAGSNRLLRDGATLVLEPDEVVQELARQLPDSAARPLLIKDEEQARVLAALRSPRSLEQLTCDIDIPTEQLRKTLLDLELKGSVMQQLDGRFCLTQR